MKDEEREHKDHSHKMHEGHHEHGAHEKHGHEMHEEKEHQKHVSHEHSHEHHIEDFKRRFIVSAILTIPILIFSDQVQEWLGYTIDFAGRRELLLVLGTIIYVYGGTPFLRGLVGEIRKRQPGMMTLIGMAISVAFFYSAAIFFFGGRKDFFWELSTLVDIMLFGHWIEAKSVLGASRALEELVKVMPTMAHLVKNGDIIDVPIKELKPGDIVLVRPGEKIPSDGIVVEGEGHVNEALLTGESLPVNKKPGDKVIGGSINVEGALKVKIEKTGEETYLAQVIKLVKQAQESRSKTQDLANKAAAILFYVALFAGITSYAYWSIVGSVDFAIERAVTVMVIACPHALGLAIPLVVAISTSVTAKNGILIRDRLAFENARKVDAVVFDKTGTLTEGKFGVVAVASTVPEKQAVAMAASVENYSEHIIARAIVEYAESIGVNYEEAQEFKAIPGKGAYGIVDGKKIYVGGPGLLKELGLDEPKELKEKVSGPGRTVVYVISDSKVIGAIALADKVREESREAIKKLKEMGIKVYMLTGDSRDVAEWVSKELGIDEFFAQVLPHEKSEKVKQLKERGHVVAMVGDGINDAPALVTADVGIAIGAGTDVAIESADIILVKNDPRDVARIIDMSRKTYRKMLENLFWATGYNTIAIPLAAGVGAAIGIILTPAMGAILMSLSTVIVAINSKRLEKKL